MAGRSTAGSSIPAGKKTRAAGVGGGSSFYYMENLEVQGYPKWNVPSGVGGRSSQNSTEGRFGWGYKLPDWREPVSNTRAGLPSGSPDWTLGSLEQGWDRRLAVSRQAAVRVSQ